LLRIAAGIFRADRYYRVNVFPIDAPPLWHGCRQIAVGSGDYKLKRLRIRQSSRIRMTRNKIGLDSIYGSRV
jgi:transcriptional regulator with GAF, ATPase, and Fis domain